MTLLKTQPVISIIIPVYNVENYLKSCLESVVHQTYQNLEIVIVDDGSTDTSASICTQYQRNYDNIKLIKQKNSGLSSARNTGIHHSSGEYIAFIDADDVVNRDYVNTLFHALITTNADLSIVATLPFRRSQPKRHKTKSNILVMSPREAISNILLEKGFTVSACAKLYHRKLFSNIKFPTGKLYEDNATTYKLFLECNKIAFSPSAQYYYRMRPGSITKSKFTPQKLDYIDLVDQSCKEIATHYPSLEHACLIRQINARLSVLYQILDSKPTKLSQSVKKDIFKFLKNNRIVLSYKESNLKLKIEAFLASYCPAIFHFTMKTYKTIKYFFK